MAINDLFSRKIIFDDDALYNIEFNFYSYESDSTNLTSTMTHTRAIIHSKGENAKTTNIKVSNFVISITGGDGTNWSESIDLDYVNDGDAILHDFAISSWPVFKHPAADIQPEAEMYLGTDIAIINVKAIIDGRSINSTRYLRVPRPKSMGPILSYMGQQSYATDETTHPYILPARPEGAAIPEYNFIINQGREGYKYEVYLTIYPAFDGNYHVQNKLLKTITPTVDSDASTYDEVSVTLDLHDDDYMWDFNLQDSLTVGNITLKKYQTIAILTLYAYDANGNFVSQTQSNFIYEASNTALAPRINSLTITDINTASANATGYPTSRFVAGVSDVNYKIVATPFLDATIVKYEISNESLYVTGASGHFGILTDATFTVTVTDSKGLSTTKTYTYIIYPYIPLSATIYAKDASAGDDAIAYVEVTGKFYDSTFGENGNALTAHIRYKYGEEDWVDWIDITDYVVLGESSYKTENLFITLDPDKYQQAITWQAQVSDAVVTIDSANYVSITIPVFDWGKEDFNFNVPVNINGSLTIDGKQLNIGTWTPVCNACQKPTVAYGNYFAFGDMCIINFYYQGVANTTPSNNLYFSGLPFTPDTKYRWQGGGGNCSGYRVQTANQVFSGWTIESNLIYGRANSGNLTAGATSSSGYISVTSGTTFYATGTIMYKFTSI